ncbi:MAG: hypothetical protein PHX70_02585 [Clostridium sp.]|nr:hypothetical protein [Clostridium sp.]
MKIILSENAYSNLYDILKDHPEYNCVRLSYSFACCSRVNMDIILDEIKEDDLSYKIKDLNFAYSMETAKKVSEVNIIYENSNFMIKCKGIKDNSFSSCKSCSKNTNCSKCKH